tara:strand:+ start:65 stop:1219 length:1155 start_codon:yes stop_codon:yes gene_type:complete
MNLQKLRLGQLKPADGSATVGDLHFPKVKLLLPFDGSNGATSTTDSSNTGNTITFNGNAQISTTQSKFGSSSAYFDGTGDYIDLGGSSLRSVCDSGDFALELWFYQDSRSSWTNLITNYGTGNGGWAVYINNDSPNQLYWWHYNGSGWVYLNYTQGTRTTITLDTWHHVAVTRNGNTWRLFLNGVQEDTITDSNNITASNGAVSSGLRLGTINAGLQYPLHGYIDDVRITNGDSRYTSNFTPPTTAHLTSAGDVNKHIVVNSDADGVAIGTGGINQTRIAKAWVRIHGAEAAADMIQSSYNVSSITDGGVGKYQVNFSTAMTDASYSAVASFGSTSAGYYGTVGCARVGGTTSTTACQMSTSYDNSGTHTFADFGQATLHIFGN